MESGTLISHFDKYIILEYIMRLLTLLLGCLPVLITTSAFFGLFGGRIIVNSITIGVGYALVISIVGMIVQIVMINIRKYMKKNFSSDESKSYFFTTSAIFSVILTLGFLAAGIVCAVFAAPFFQIVDNPSTVDNNSSVVAGAAIIRWPIVLSAAFSFIGMLFYGFLATLELYVRYWAS